jgi:hypothetical protein
MTQRHFTADADTLLRTDWYKWVAQTKASLPHVVGLQTFGAHHSLSVSTTACSFLSYQRMRAPHTVCKAIQRLTASPWVHTGSMLFAGDYVAISRAADISKVLLLNLLASNYSTHTLSIGFSCKTS